MMRILLSNDDGIHGPGLRVLERIAKTLSDDVWVCVPEVDQSGAGHSLTLRKPFRVRKVSHQKYAISGTPSDCVLTAIDYLMKDKKPDLVLSGVNLGANLGEHLTSSGTVAAAIRGCLSGIPSIALSLKKTPPHPAKWSTAEHHAPEIIKKLYERGIESDTLININFPDVISSSVKGIMITEQGFHRFNDNVIERHDPRGRPYYWIGPLPDQEKTFLSEKAVKNTDIYAIVKGYISITPLSLNLTCQEMLSPLKKLFP